MVFGTINSELSGVINNFSILNTSVADLLNAFTAGSSGTGIQKIISGLLSLKNATSSVITQKDIDNINAYNQQIEDGVTPQTAWYRTMQTSSKAAKDLVAGANGAKVSTEGLTVATKASKAAMIGAKVAAVALNVALTMGLSYAIQAVVSGLDNLIHASTNASEAADELKNSSMQAAEEANEETKKLDELIKKYEELAKSDNQDSSTRTEIKQVQSDIVDLVGQQANNLDLVNGKLDDELEKLNQIRREEAARAVDSNVSAYRKSPHRRYW